MKYELKFTLRIDEETHRELSILAEKEERSLNSQIIYIVKKYIEDQKQKEKDNKQKS